MAWFDKEYEAPVDMTEIYRQNYEDALDEIRNLRYKIKELQSTNLFLEEELDRATNTIILNGIDEWG